MPKAAHWTICALLLPLLVAGCGSGSSSDKPIKSQAAPAAQDTSKDVATDSDSGKDTSLSEVQETVQALSIPERAGQLIITKLDGTVLSETERRELGAHHIGGVILFAYNYQDRRQFQVLNADVQKLMRSSNSQELGALISIDQEGGFVRRITDLPPQRGQSELGKVNDPEVTRRTAGAAAVGLAKVGINLNLAPVADLDLPPKNVMGARAYGSDPDLVADHVAAAVEGSEENGVATSPKHFPGFGGSTINSDFGVARVARSAKQLEDDLKPFRAAIEADAATIMVSHGLYSSLDSARPASLSKRIVTDLLREDLGYEGVAMTDSLNASGLRGAWKSTVPRACVEAVKVGIDIVLLTGSLETARLCRQRITRAVYAGEISEERLNEAAERVVTLKRGLGL